MRFEVSSSIPLSTKSTYNFCAVFISCEKQSRIVLVVRKAGGLSIPAVALKLLQRYREGCSAKPPLTGLSTM